MSAYTQAARPGWQDLISKLTKPITECSSPQHDKAPSNINDLLFRTAQIATQLRANGHQVRGWNNILIRHPGDVLIDGARLAAVESHVLEFERAISWDMATRLADLDVHDLLSALATKERAIQAATEKAKALEDELDELKWDMRRLNLEQEEAAHEHSACVEAVWGFGDPEELWFEVQELRDKVTALKDLADDKREDEATVRADDGEPTSKQPTAPVDNTILVNTVIADLGKERRDALASPHYDRSVDHSYTGIDARLELRTRENLTPINAYPRDMEETSKDKQWRRKPKGVNHILLKLKELAVHFEDRHHRVRSWHNMLIRGGNDSLCKAPRMKEIKAAIEGVTREHYQSLVVHAMEEWNQTSRPKIPDGPVQHQPPDLRPEVARLRRAVQTLQNKHDALQKHSDQQMLELEGVESAYDDLGLARDTVQDLTRLVDQLHYTKARLEKKVPPYFVEESKGMLKELHEYRTKASHFEELADKRATKIADWSWKVR